MSSHMTQSARKYTDIYNAQGHSTAVEHTIDKHFKQIHDDAKKACMNAGWMIKRIGKRDDKK